MNRRAQERQRAAERKAAADAREVISRAERSASRRAGRHRLLIRDAVRALVIALISFGAWKLTLLLARKLSDLRRGRDTLDVALLTMSGPAEVILGGATLNHASREWRGSGKM